MVGRNYILARICLLVGIIIIALILTCWILFPDKADSGSPICAEGDLDGDGRVEEYLLEDQCLTVKEGEQYIWKSPEEWSVDYFVIGDADNDGTNNLVISLWKAGSFGTIRPFWMIGEDIGWKNHLFVFKLEVNNNFKSVWCSSDLDCPIISFEILDADGDGLNELMVQEGQYRKIKGERYALNTDTPVSTTIWQWEEWGFSRKM